MARVKYKLTARMVEQVREPGLYADGDGLFLQVKVGRHGPTRSWLVRYTAPTGKRRDMGIGRADLVTLADAREEARSVRQQAKAGIDPISQPSAERLSASSASVEVMTFKACVELFIASRASQWRGTKHAKLWQNSLESHAYPVLGDLSVAAVDKERVLQVLQPIWSSKTVTASRLRGRVEAVLNWATAHGHRTGENPARWRGHLEYALVSPAKIHSVRHHPAIPVAEMPAFYNKLTDKNSAGADCLRFVILTGARFNEAAGARWQEFDMKAAIWTVPSVRMKGGRPHRVPLAPETVTLLALRKQRTRSTAPDALVFESDMRKGARLSDSTLLAVVRRTGRTETVHGCRSTMRVWVDTHTDFSGDLAEMSLAHQVGNAVERAYRRDDLLEKRRKLIEAWSEFCASARSKGLAPVIAFSARATP